MASLPAKLQIKPGHRVRLVAAPDGAAALLQPLPEDVRLTARGAGPFDVVVLFAKDRAALDRGIAGAIAVTRRGGVLWVAYPKKGSPLEGDLSRDAVWRALKPTGWTPVAQVAIDDTWSALRFRPLGEVQRARREEGT
ncbi:MAG: hypothetical protein ACM3OO_08740 [Planctomycetaceae bacterium]